MPSNIESSKKLPFLEPLQPLKNGVFPVFSSLFFLCPVWSFVSGNQRRMKITYILSALAFSVIGCNNNADTSGSADSTTTISDSVQTEPISELHSLDSLPVDSIYVKYGNVIQVVYGARDDDKLIVEGDMKFELPDNYLNERRKYGITRMPAPQIERFTFGIGSSGKLWPVKNGIIEIPFIIHPAMFDSSRVLKAIQWWENTGLVHFIPSTGQDATAEFMNSRITQSDVGRAGPHPTVELEKNMRVGNVAHEIGHLLGLFHEQCRSDRDSFVSIVCAKDINYQFAFKSDSSATNVDHYNLNSIMHYRPDRCMKVIARNLPRNIPGQRDSITLGDIASIKALYHLKK